MIPTQVIPVGLPKISLAFDWPTQMKIPRTAPASESECAVHPNINNVITANPISN